MNCLKVPFTVISSNMNYLNIKIILKTEDMQDQKHRTLFRKKQSSPN